MGLDENLPVFVVAGSPDRVKHHAGIYHTISGDEPELVYIVKHADPSLDHSRNCYAAALFDAHTADVLYGEVLLRPDWVQPNLSRDELRRHEGVPPPPEPVLPAEFTIQLYNPDQQIVFTQKTGRITGSSKWEFAIPQDTFRNPSASILDRTQHDPAADATTPKITFAWKKDFKFGNTLSCVITGKSTDVLGRKKSKEPDITIAMYKSLKELTLYEPNLSRAELQDPKGLEITLLLSSVVLRDVYYGQMKNAFNITDPSSRRTSNPSPIEPVAAAAAPALPPRHGAGRLPAAANGLYGTPPAAAPTSNSNVSSSQPNKVLRKPQAPSSRPPITDPRTQWEIDAETARLKAVADSEARQEEARRREQQRRADEETMRLRKQVEAEDRERRRKKDEAIDKETQRLQRLYGQGQPQPQPQPQEHPPMQPPRPPSQYQYQQDQQQQQQPYQPAPSPYPPNAAVMTSAIGPHATQFQNQAPAHPYSGFNYNPEYPRQIPPHFMPPPASSTPQPGPPSHSGRRRTSLLDMQHHYTERDRGPPRDLPFRPNSTVQ